MTAPAQGRKWLTLAAMCFGLFLIMLDNTIVNVALPSIQRQLNASPSTLEWTINAYVLAFAVLIMLGGKLGDRFGRKKMFLVGLTIFTAMSAACALAPTAEWLVAFRTGQGVGGALMNPLTLSIIVAAFPRRGHGCFHRGPLASGCLDALRRDGRREIPGGDRGDDGSHHPHRGRQPR